LDTLGAFRIVITGGFIIAGVNIQLALEYNGRLGDGGAGK
jgi:hypothetical protein